MPYMLKYMCIHAYVYIIYMCIYTYIHLIEWPQEIQWIFTYTHTQMEKDALYFLKPVQILS
jgi:hypothetical protein